MKTSASFTNDYSSRYGGRCSITLPEVVVDAENATRYSVIAGTFTAELFPTKRKSPKVTIEDGVFR